MFSFHSRYSVLAGITYGIAYGFAQALIFLGYAVTFRFGAWQSVQPINDRFFARFEHIYTVFMALIFGSLALGQANSFAPSYIKAKIAAKKIFALLDRRSQIDSYSKEGLNHVRVCVSFCMPVHVCMHAFVYVHMCVRFVNAYNLMPIQYLGTNLIMK